MFKLARGLSLSSYRRGWLARDVIAGVVLTTLLVPWGMAYAELAGLPPITRAVHRCSLLPWRGPSSPRMGVIAAHPQRLVLTTPHRVRRQRR